MRKVQNIIHTFHPDTHAINQASVHELCIKQRKRKDLPRRDRKFHAYTNSPTYVATKMNSTPSRKEKNRRALPHYSYKFKSHQKKTDPAKFTSSPSDIKMTDMPTPEQRNQSFSTHKLGRYPNTTLRKTH